MKNKQLLAIAVAGAMSAQAMAESPLVESPLEESASKTQKTTDLNMVQVVGKATVGIDDIITKEQLENAQANDLTDIFAWNPQVSAGGGVALGQKIYVRNIGEDMLNITIDGASQAGGVFHHSGRVVIEPDLLKQVEVEAGAGSATAGFGALGGAVRFVTKDPEDMLRGNELAGGTIKSTFYSNGESVKNSATVYGMTETGRFGGLVNFISADFNNREDGDGNEIVGSETENQVGFAKGVMNINDQQKLSISYESLEQEGDILYRPEWIPSIKNPISPTQANRHTIIANYEFNMNDMVNLTVNAYNTNVEQTRSYYVPPEYEGTVETSGFTVENTSVIGNNTLIYGVNYQDDKAKLKDDSGTTSGEEKGEIIGLYVQDILTFSEVLTITAGFRFDDYSLTDINGQDISDTGFSPNISANYYITPELNISAGYSEALRGVTIADAYVMYPGSYKNAANIKAETANNIEVAAEYNKGAISASVGVYKATIEDPIGKTYPEIWSDTYRNGEDIKTDGYFLTAGYSDGGVNVLASFNRAESEQNGLRVTRYQHASSAASMGDTLVVDANYQVTPAWFVGWTGQLVRSLDPEAYTFVDGGAPSEVTVEKEGYNTHDLYVRWSPMIDDTLVVNLTVKNVSDETYLNQASPEDLTGNPDYEIVSGQKDPGRDIRLSVAYKF